MFSDNSMDFDLGFFDSMSGYVQTDGEMTSDFIGGSIGKNGVIYGTIEAPLAPGPSLYDVGFSQGLENFKTFSDLFSTQLDISDALKNDGPDTNFKTFNYNVDVPAKVRRTGENSQMINGTVKEVRTGVIYNNDTIVGGKGNR